jgi:hypothetical protein
VQRILDAEEREYLHEIRQATDVVVIDGYTGLLSVSICQKSSLAIVEYGRQNGIYSLVKLGTILFVHFCNDQPSQDASRQFMNEFDAAVDRAIEEIRLKSSATALGGG